MHPHYHHLCFADRLTIEVMLAEGHPQSTVALAIGVHRSTISRERLLGLTHGSDRYFAVIAQREADARRCRAGRLRRKFDEQGCSPYWKLVLPFLRRGWSPEQAAGKLRLMNSPCTVSHETIYAAIYAMPRSMLRTELVKLLRHSHAGRLPRARGSARFTGLQNMTPIALRPPEVAARIVPGHWEADLIKGASNASAVGAIVERTSRFLMLARLDNASASSVLEGFSRRLRTVPPSLRKTLTYDQGTEMALHQDLAKRLRMDIYFCDPHSPWQRGTNENMNGLVREYLPKGTSLASLTDADLRRIEDSINNRPRKLLGFYTPSEVFSALKRDDILGVALQA
jgi:transposase, IS30 family